MKRLFVGAVAALLLTGCGSGAEKLNQQGNEAYAEQSYEVALESYQQAAALEPELAAPVYNSASVLYQLTAYDEAGEALNSAMQTADSALTQQGYFNLGNTFFQAQEYAQAAEAFKHALRLDPADRDAKYNLELTLRKLEEADNPEQPQEEQAPEDQPQEEQEDQPQEEPSQGSQGQEDEQQSGGQSEDQQQDQSEEQDQSAENRDEQQNSDSSSDQESDPSQTDEQSGDPQDEPTSEPTPGPEHEGEQTDQGDGDQPATPTPTPDPAGNPGENGQPQPGDQNPPEPGQGSMAQLQGLSNEQARQLLQAASQGTQTLQEYLQQIYVFPPGDVDEDW
ncbi:MAG: tetratricopeptide repeat protein [Caldilineaceae bacterium]|nr:tetratricopeptide repeat protein [Caldilineaceae bacterium]